MLENWQFSEPALASTSTKFGSGYPSDPVCKQWMEDNLHCKTFAYPDVIRFSWAPTKKKLDNGNKAAKVVFAADIEDDEDEDMTINRKRQQDHMSAFLGKKQKRLPYFQRKGLNAVSKFF
jgi:ribonuclease H2 subunit A